MLFDGCGIHHPFCESLTTRISLRYFDTWRDLVLAIRQHPLGTLVIADPRNGDGTAVCPEFEVLRHKHPVTPLWACFPVAETHAPLLARLIALGVQDVIDLNGDVSQSSVDRRLRLGRGQVLKEVLQRILPPAIPARTRIVLLIAAEVAEAGGLAAELGEALGTSGKSASRLCEGVHLPKPRRLLAWLRLLFAAELLARTQCSISAVAVAAWYANQAGLRNAFRQVANVTPAEVRSGGPAVVANRFLQELFAIHG